MIKKFGKEPMSYILLADFLFHFFGNYQLALSTLVALNKLKIDSKDEFSKYLLQKKIEKHLQDILVNAEDETANQYAIHIVIKVEDYYKQMIEVYRKLIHENVELFEKLDKEQLNLIGIE